MGIWRSLSAAWDRVQLLVFRVGLRACDLIVLILRPRLLGTYLRLFWLEIRHSPYKWPRSFEATLARTQSGQGVRELVYGETPVVTGIWLFRRAGVDERSKLVDLGAGRGRALIAARWLGAQARGVELLAEHVRLVSGPLGRAGIALEAGDGADADLSDATHVYLTWTGLNQLTRDRFVERLETCQPGTRVIAVDAPVEHDSFTTLSRHDLLFPWGSLPVWIHERDRSSSAPV
ncbi:class I SAM-dependent methyltransferase [Myxococcota bacterium]